MPVFRISAGSARRLAAVALLPLAVAGCAATAPALPELQAAAAPAAAPESAFAGYQAFAPGPRDDWRRLEAAGGGMAMPMSAPMSMPMDHGQMDHGKMDHGMTQQAMPVAPVTAAPLGPVAPPPADAPAHQH